MRQPLSQFLQQVYATQKGTTPVSLGQSVVSRHGKAPTRLFELTGANVSFVNQCQVSENPEIQAIAKTFIDANRKTPAFAV